MGSLGTLLREGYKFGAANTMPSGSFGWVIETFWGASGVKSSLFKVEGTNSTFVAWDMGKSRT